VAKTKTVAKEEPEKSNFQQSRIANLENTTQESSITEKEGDQNEGLLRCQFY